MMQHAVLSAMILIASAAPGQDSKNPGMGQMREVSTPPVRKAPAQPAPRAASADSQPTAAPAQPPVAANQSAAGEGDNTEKATGPRRSPLSTLRDNDGEPRPRRLAPSSDVLDRLRERRDRTPVIPPVQPGVKRVERTQIADNAIPENALRPVDRKLMPDGARIVDRAGRLTRDGDYLTFTFESRGEGPIEVPLRLLPNRLLENMEQIAEDGRKSVVFVVSGEVTEYRGVNYLLLEKLLIRPDLGNFR